MNIHIKSLSLATIATLFACFPALADDWVAEKLRGKVFVFSSGEWAPLKRGDVVSDDRVIRTLRGGRVAFKRDGETIELSPNTQIQINDRTGKRFTTVAQSYGRVAIEAEVENVKHFAVVNQFMVATVKGTRFTVQADDNGSSVVVDRGSVEVRDTVHHAVVTVSQGQKAESGEDILSVSGLGDLPAVRTSNITRGGNSNSHKDENSKSGNEGNSSSRSDGNGNSGNGNSRGDENSNSGNGNSRGDENSNSGNGNSRSDENSNSGNGRGKSGN